MKTVRFLLVATLLLASGVAAAGPQYFGYGPYGYGPEGPYAGPMSEVLDPADAEALLTAAPGAAEDEPGFGQWGPSDAGAQQPGNGAPFSGPRPPK